MKKSALFILLLGLLAGAVQAQDDDNTLVIMNAANNGQTFPFVLQSNTLTLNIKPEMDTINGGYHDGPFDRSITTSAQCEEGKVPSFLFEEFDVDPSDTVFVYDGPNTSYPLMIASNNALNSLYLVTVYATNANSTGMLTIRFKTNGDGHNGSGFSVRALCRQPCEVVTPVIDSVYDKTRNGEIVGHGTVRYTMQVQKIYNADSTEIFYDTQYFRGVHLCVGEGVIFHGHGEYTNNYSHYHASDDYSLFDWKFGNGDTLSGINATSAPTFYRDVDCYDVTLRITDIMGCKSLSLETVRVRIAQNPIKTIYDLAPMCTSDSTEVVVGYGPGTAIRLTEISFEKSKSKTIECKTFIPDGRDLDCPQADAEKGFRAPIFFDEFPAGRTVTSAGDICSVCINYEHSFMGDYRLSLFCPSGKRIVLKYGIPGMGISQDPLPVGNLRTDNPPGDIDPKGCGGGGMYTGIPYGGSGHDGYDIIAGMGGCDSVDNMFGVGFDYCFSRNHDYLLVNGSHADEEFYDSDAFIAAGGYTEAFTDYTFQTIPAPYTKVGQTANPSSFSTKLHSNHEEKTDYYLPADDFEKLVDCPLNGEWAIQIIDFYKIDNGWIFNWSLDICGINQGLGCEYQVPIDSVLWQPDSTYGDFETGHYRGLNIDNRTETKAVITSPDTAGTFRINVRIFDSFGCEWDTTTNITSVWSPKPELGTDRLICDVESLVLDAKDRHTPTTNQSFTWEPFGQISDTIHTRPEMGTSTLYEVKVENFEHDKFCVAFDSVRVNINHQPVANFDPGIYPMEGCEPFTLTFDNTTQYGDEYLWVFGDGDSSTAMSPTHTYGVGQYDLKYYVSNYKGCNDSLIYKKLITVYSSPVARFSWEPMNPTVLHPQVSFQNLTVPQSDRNKYFWEIQYDRDNPISYHTLTDVNPTFEWTTDGEDISGTYTSRLIVLTENMGPSGNIIECRDTIENKILLVNDFLQFPSAITPNGDGVNDRFEIINLINGLGYPNNSLAIYDRWGKRVYYKENISSEDDFWDPSNVPAGTYFWRFVGKGYLGDIQRNGAVEVIK